ncbi:MAG: PAS domain S-box protein [Methanomicrobiales archaeon]
MISEIIRVLYVDDELSLLDLGKTFLERGGVFSVETCSSVNDARERLRNQDYDLILSDYQMPETDGLEFLKELRASDNRTPFIIFTGRGREEVVIEALNSGADFYLQKGGDPKSQFTELANKIRYAVSRRQAEESLAMSEEKFRGIFDTVNDAIHIHAIAPDGKPGQFIEVNEVACRMLQYTRKDLLALGPLDMVAGSHSRPLDTILGELSTTGHTIFETEHRRKDGTVVPVEINTHVVTLQGKRVMVSVVRDISGRRKAEAALQESEGRFRTLSNAAMEGIMIHDRGVIKDCNSRFASLFGYTPQEIIDRNGFEFMMTAESREAITRWRRSGGEGTIDITGIRKDGTTFFGETASAKLLWMGKEHSIVQIRDISGRKRAEDELRAAYEQISAADEELRDQYEELAKNEQFIRESEEKFRTLLDASIDGIMLIDFSGSILAWNPATEKIFGIPANEALGSNIVDLQIRLIVPEHRNPAYIEELRSRFSATFPALFSRTSPLFLEVEVMNARGQRMIVQQALYPIQTSRGKRIGCISRDVTQQRSAEKSLRESENKFRTLFENSGDAIMFIDREVVLDCNTRTEVIFGKTRAQIIGMSPGGLSPDFQPDGQSSAETALEKMTAAFLGEPQFFDWVHVRTDGSLFDAEVTLNRVEVGGKYYLQAIVRDITDRKKMETALRESEEHYRSVVNNQSDMIARFTPDGIIQFVNESYRAYFTSSLDVSEIVGKSIRNLMQIKNYPEVAAFLGSLTPENPVREAERQFTGSDGESYWQTWSVRAIFGPDLKVTEYQVVGRDITERKRAEEALVTEKQFSDAVMDSIPGTFFVLDDQGNFVRTNKNQEKLIGYTAEEMVGTSGFATIAEVDRDRLVARMHEILETGYGTDTALVITRDGRTFPMLLTAVSTMIGGKRYIIGTGIDISELKTAEKELQESEERFRALSDAALEGIMIHNKGVIVDCNPRFAEMFGYTPGEIIGRNGFEFMLTPESRDAIFRWGKSGFLGSIDITAIRKDGTRFSGETSAAMIAWKGKSHNIVHMRDITDRKRVEEMLRQNEKQIREIFGWVNDGIQIHDIEPDGKPGKFIEVNEVACRMLQYTREELLEIGPLDISTEYHSRPLNDILMELSTYGHSIFETEHRRKDGILVPVEVNTHVVSLLGKKVMVGVVRDITGRKQAEEALRESEERYRSLYVDNRDAIMILSPDSGFLTGNPATIQLFGCRDEQDFKVRTPVSLSPEYQPDGILSRDKSQEMMSLALEKGSHFFEWTHRRIDGRDFPATVLLSRLESGSTCLLQATIRDISERKELENEMKYHEQELMQFSMSLATANKKLALLSGITRHDILNQLTVLIGYLELLEIKQPDPAFSSYFNKITTAAERIQAMIKFTKTYEGIGVNAPIWQNSRTLVDTAAKDVALGEIRLVNDLPSDMTVFADQLIVKVFFNLMDNAVRHGEKITTIRFSVEESGDEHIILYEDDGVGIPADEKEKIFERGFGKNTGLGLFLSREILAITGITIKEIGEPGEGARFEMTVPKGMWRMNPGSDQR